MGDRRFCHFDLGSDVVDAKLAAGDETRMKILCTIADHAEKFGSLADEFFGNVRHNCSSLLAWMTLALLHGRGFGAQYAR